MAEKISPIIDDYLGVIYVLERDSEPIQGTRLAEIFNVTPPTVTNTLKRMVRDGFLESDPHAKVRLTSKGKEAAANILSRHMLAEWMLSKILSWSKVHHEAHFLEHGISEEVKAALMVDLDKPELCPHGNPLPGNEKLVEGWIPLTETHPGDSLIIRRIHELAEEMPGLLDFLESNNISTGVHAVVVDILPINQTVELKIEDKPVTLGFSIAKNIFAEPIDKPKIIV